MANAVRGSTEAIAVRMRAARWPISANPDYHRAGLWLVRGRPSAPVCVCPAAAFCIARHAWRICTAAFFELASLLASSPVRWSADLDTPLTQAEHGLRSATNAHSGFKRFPELRLDEPARWWVKARAWVTEPAVQRVVLQRMRHQLLVEGAPALLSQPDAPQQQQPARLSPASSEETD